MSSPEERTPYISGHQFVKDAPHLFPYSFGYAQVEPAPADHLLFFISDDLQTSFIDKRNPSLSIQRYYQHSRDVEILLRLVPLFQENFFGVLSLGNVSHHMDQACDLSVAVKAGDRPDLYEHVQMRLEQFRGGGSPCHEALAARAPFRRTACAVVVLETFCLPGLQEGKSQYLLGGLVGANDIIILVMDGHHVRDGIEGLLPFLLRLDNLVFQLLAGSKILQGLDGRNDLTAAVPDRRRVEHNIAVPAVQSGEPGFRVQSVRHQHGF